MLYIYEEKQLAEDHVECLKDEIIAKTSSKIVNWTAEKKRGFKQKVDSITPVVNENNKISFSIRGTLYTIKDEEGFDIYVNTCSLFCINEKYDKFVTTTLFNKDIPCTEFAKLSIPLVGNYENIDMISSMFSLINLEVFYEGSEQQVVELYLYRNESYNNILVVVVPKTCKYQLKVSR